MLARYHFLFPCLYLGLFGKGIGLEYAVDNFWELPTSLVNIIDLADETFDTSRGVIAV